MNTDLFSLEGKTALVTGGGRGVGSMCAAALLDFGAEVVITSRRAQESTDFASLAERGPCHFVQVDLAAPDGIDQVRAALMARQDSLDILVNNAGVTWGAPFEDYPADAWDKVLRLDVAVPFRMVQALLPLLEAAGAPHAPARVINIGSVDGHAVGTFDNFAYSAGKAGLHQVTRVLAHRLGPRHIAVNALAPGPVMTKMTAELLKESGTAVVDANPLGRLAEPDDIAGALIYLASTAGSYITGVVLAVDGGFSLGSWSTIALG
jgi:NAD(P)-dependent dehydrogenase (short-subunit alcohol dehydrogenase family)